jgi:hypothetical protein
MHPMNFNKKESWIKDISYHKCQMLKKTVSDIWSGLYNYL